MPDAIKDEPQEKITVVAPSGAEFHMLVEGEKQYFADKAQRYLTDNHFINISDLQDLDRIIFMETMCWRWGLWLSQEADYWGQNVDLDALQRSLNEYSRELRLLKKALGMDKVNRDKEKGESIAEYVESLRIRAREFGIMREEQLAKGITLFKELKSLVVLHDNCNEQERHENHIEMKDIMEWLREVAFPEFDAIDEYFRKNKQKMWIRKI